MMSATASPLVLKVADEAAPEGLDVSRLEDEICQLLADFLQLHKKVGNGTLVVKMQQESFAFVQLTFDRKPHVIYPQTS